MWLNRFVVTIAVLGTLVSCSSPSPDEQAASDAYNSARSALLAGNEQNLRNALSADRIKSIEQMNAKNGKTFADFMTSQRAYVPDGVKIVKVDVNENGAFLTLEGTRDGKTIQGNSWVKREGGGWKVENENWFWKGLPQK